MIKIKTGKSNTSDSVKKGKYLFFDRSSIIKKSNKFIFDGEYVIVPGEGSNFIPIYFKGKFDLHQRAYALSVNEKFLMSKYLYYFLCKNSEEFKKFSVGSTVPSLRLNSFKWIFEKKFPTIKEQQKIIELIEPLEDLFLKFSKIVDIRTLEKAKIGIRKIKDIFKPIENLENKIQLTQKKILEIIKNFNQKNEYFYLNQVSELLKNKKKNIDQISAKSMNKRHPNIKLFEKANTYKTNTFFTPKNTLLINTIRTYLEKFCIVPKDSDSTGTLAHFLIKKNHFSILHNLLNKEFWSKANNLSKGTKMPQISSKDIFNNIKFYKIKNENEINGELLFSFISTCNNLIILINKLKEKAIKILI